MGLGVLEDRVMANVPGTTRYYDDPLRPQMAQADGTDLKCDTNGPEKIILVPQPTDDPNDPLNWPLWKRDLIIFILSTISIFTTALGPILAANTLTLSLYFERTFTAMALLTGYFLLGVGIAGILAVPSSRIWGKRHLFILGTIIVIVSSYWGGKSRTYKSLLWARIFQGIGTAPFEGLVNAAVADMYYVHERGKRMAVTNLAVFGGSFFTPIVVGKITHTIGWPWSFYFVSIFCTVMLPFMIFFMPETAYPRPKISTTDFKTMDNHKMPEDHEDNQDIEMKSPEIFTQDRNDAENEAGSSHPKAGPQSTMNEGLYAGPPSNPSFRSQHHFFSKSSIAIFSGRKTDESFWKLFLRPFPLFLHPGIVWACLIQATMIGWTVFIGVILAAIFLGPPLFFDEVKTGYAYTGAFLGAILGFLVAGGLSDWSVKILTKWNKGIYEPEFRIYLVGVQALFGLTGLYGFGITSARVKYYGWFWPVFFFGLEVAGMVVGAVASSLYIVDAHREIAVEALTCMLVFKNLFAFALTFKAYEWLVHHGVHRTFMTISTIQVFVCLLAVPMYVFGKRNRSYFYRHDILKKCGLW